MISKTQGVYILKSCAARINEINHSFVIDYNRSMQEMDNARTQKRRQIAASGGWWGFNKYEIKDGYIQPSPRARLQHWDPWGTFWEVRKLTVGQSPDATQPPYQSLMKLLHALEYLPGPQRYDRLTPESLSRITTWSEEYGPLGVLLARWEAITLAPVSRAAGGTQQRTYVRATGQAVETLMSSGDMEPAKPRVIIHELDGVNPNEEAPGQTWYRFFPTVDLRERNEFQYPEPYSESFCHLYREPLVDFCKAARLLTGAMLYLQPEPPPAVDLELARSQALDTMNRLRRTVSSVLGSDDAGKPAASWQSPSLLSSFAEMYVQDLMFGRQALTCACCGAPFVSSAYQAQFCSKHCRYRGQKRRLRQQMREAKALHGKGKTVKQIAAELDQDPDVVARWLSKL
jgi:hypothetical protein